MTEAPRILVMGAGSIGTRHIRNLVDLGARVEFVDPAATTGSTHAAASTATEVFDPSPDDYDGVVIATPNSMHGEHLHWALSGSAVVLVEKPMVTSTSELDNEILGHADRILVGYNLRFHTGYGELRHRLLRGDIGRPVAARLWFGSYLPDWRPTIDYRESYSARCELGGGVLRDASHELDLAAWFFGQPLSVASAWMGRVGDLEIDVEDTVRTTLVTASGIPVRDRPRLPQPYLPTRHGDHRHRRHGALRLATAFGDGRTTRCDRRLRRDGRSRRELHPPGRGLPRPHPG